MKRYYDELRTIKAARMNGRRLGIEPMLTDSQPIVARERHLMNVLGLTTTPVDGS
jgi:hypothetical protein